jgi:hypothetical protein
MKYTKTLSCKQGQASTQDKKINTLPGHFEPVLRKGVIEVNYYQASKRRYYYGLKIHLLTTQAGHPVEFFLTPASYSDTPTLKQYLFDLPEGSQIAGDKAYNDYGVEDLLHEVGLELTPIRKKNSKRPLKPWVKYLVSSYRKLVETTGSLVEQMLPKHIHAVTAAGFEFKVALFVLACSINYLVR